MQRIGGRNFCYIGSILCLVWFGCTPDTGRRNEAWQGLALPQTADFEASSSLFLISTDGLWLLFESNSVEPGDPVLALYDLERQRRLPVAAADEAASQLGNVVLDGVRAFFDSQAQAFVVPTLAGNADFMVEIAPNAYKAELSFRATASPASPAPQPRSGLLEVVSVSTRELEIRRADGATLARHKVSGLDNNLQVLEIRTSATGDFAAYRITGTRAGSFTFGPEGYVVDLRRLGRPRLIGARVYSPFCWNPQGGSLFAYAADPEGQRAIFEWEVGRDS